MLFRLLILLRFLHLFFVAFALFLRDFFFVVFVLLFLCSLHLLPQLLFVLLSLLGDYAALFLLEVFLDVEDCLG